MNITRKSMFITFGLVLGMLSPMLAQGACSQSDLTGTWQTYALSVDAYGGYSSATTRCKVKLKSTGGIATGKSICNQRDYAGPEIVFVSGGNMKVSNSCSLEGKIKMDTPLGRQTFKMEFGTLAKDKTTFSAVGYIAEYPSIVTHVTGVKK